VRELEMVTQQLSGRSVGFEVRGTGPVIVLCHSLGANRTIFASILEDLVTDHTVLAYDMRGHGESDLGESPPGLDVLADDLFQLLRALNVDAAHLIGQSIGAMTLLAYASKFTELPVTYMVFDSVARTDSNWDLRYSERASFVEQNGLRDIAPKSAEVSLCDETRSRNPDLVGQYAAMIESTPAQGYAWACRAMLGFDLRSQLGHVRAPMLVAAGEHDTITTQSHAKEISDAVPGAVLEVVRGSGHVPCIEQPDEMIDMIRRWTASHLIGSR
jgi:3-oxoadipate enol-lactonase